MKHYANNSSWSKYSYKHHFTPLLSILGPKTTILWFRAPKMADLAPPIGQRPMGNPVFCKAHKSIYASHWEQHLIHRVSHHQTMFCSWMWQYVFEVYCFWDAAEHEAASWRGEPASKKVYHLSLLLSCEDLHHEWVCKDGIMSNT